MVVVFTAAADGNGDTARCVITLQLIEGPKFTKLSFCLAFPVLGLLECDFKELAGGTWTKLGAKLALLLDGSRIRSECREGILMKLDEVRLFTVAREGFITELVAELETCTCSLW